MNAKIKEVAPSWNHWEKTYTTDNSCKYSRAPSGFSDKFLPDTNYFIDGPVIQYYVPTVKKLLFLMNDAYDKQ